MTKACLRTVSLVSVIAMTMASAVAPVMAQTRVDTSATTVGAPQQRSVGPQQIVAPAPSPSDVPPQRAGSLQGFGPMQSNPLLGVQPMQSGGGKW